MNAANNTPERHGQDQLIPFLWLRRGIGFLGFLFPVILFLGAKWFGNCPTVLGAVSDYYHTNMGDVFVAVLCTLSLFLFTYRGPEKADSIASNLACIFALGVAFFPTEIKENHQPPCLACYAEPLPAVHNLFSAAFFLVLVYFSLFLFTKTQKGIPLTAEKIKRNTLYRCCGYIMLACILGIAVYWLFLDELPFFANIPVVFILEWIALWAFGISWIVKGGWFLEDKHPVNL